jgi:hypothetical protein
MAIAVPPFDMARGVLEDLKTCPPDAANAGAPIPMGEALSPVIAPLRQKADRRLTSMPRLKNH